MQFSHSFDTIMHNSPNPDTFYPLVWQIVRQVPVGVVSTYAQIASIIPPPFPDEADHFQRLGSKWVGEALNAVSFRDVDGTPLSPAVPWWRIINSKGGISLPSGSTAAREQQQRLLQEGVRFEGGLVALEVFGWEGPSCDWLEQYGLLKPKSLRKPPAPQQLSLF